METLHRVHAESFLRGLSGKVFSVIFTKKNGEVRKMVGRLGVRRYVKGGTNPAADRKYPYIIVYDFQKRGYRTVNLDTLEEIRTGGRIYRVIDFRDELADAAAEILTK